ncbi:hypothetical protein Lfu02_27870 [Longispora fulva]|uniref:Uncharacterized protein n=1 Tax=Longispora fulva TaxID=619741 RepID=A0A8J7GLG3_9ACTN|nr:hypothetical protein [Longispora fulva]MBG6138923.1 hypothetical protein [Longispora fulva]GIG58415.1 hypothetical protein Lfu02_27870 [Longispora fulva]
MRCPTCDTPLADTWTWCQNCAHSEVGIAPAALKPLRGLVIATCVGMAIAVAGGVLTAAQTSRTQG